MADAIDFELYPWKHPACWRAHIISMRQEEDDGELMSVAFCECGWRFSGLYRKLGPEKRDEAMHAHWQAVISAAEAAPA